jgi:hypothetical protein
MIKKNKIVTLIYPVLVGFSLLSLAIDYPANPQNNTILIVLLVGSAGLYKITSKK